MQQSALCVFIGGLGQALFRSEVDGPSAWPRRSCISSKQKIVGGQVPGNAPMTFDRLRQKFIISGHAHLPFKAIAPTVPGNVIDAPDGRAAPCSGWWPSRSWGGPRHVAAAVHHHRANEKGPPRGPADLKDPECADARDWGRVAGGRDDSHDKSRAQHPLGRPRRQAIHWYRNPLALRYRWQGASRRPCYLLCARGRRREQADVFPPVVRARLRAP
jgi:hypothetical protein